MKNILLTGGTGFIGSYLGHRLLQEGHKVKFLARGSRNQSAKERIEGALRFIDPDFDFAGQYEVIEGDITRSNLEISDKNIRETLKEINEIWHCAASISFHEEEHDMTHSVNVEGTQNVLKFAKRINVSRFHYFSTAYVAGNRLGRIYEDELDYGQKFRNPYEQTKFEAEKLVKEWEKKNHFDTSIYRLSIVVGDSETGKIPSFVGYYAFMRGFYILKKKIYQRLRNQSRYYNKSGIFSNNGFLTIPARVSCFPMGTINITTIDYVIETICKLAFHKESAGKTFHIVNDNPPQFVWLFNTGMEILGMKGFQLVNIKNSIDMPTSLLGVCNSEVLRKIESDILYACGDYSPYISGEPIFDASNKKRLLGEVFHPLVTKELINTLLRYAVEVEFGKRSSTGNKCSLSAVSLPS